jgi:hypothetical protein
MKMNSLSKQIKMINFEVSKNIKVYMNSIFGMSMPENHSLLL